MGGGQDMRASGRQIRTRVENGLGFNMGGSWRGLVALRKRIKRSAPCKEQTIRIPLKEIV